MHAKELILQLLKIPSYSKREQNMVDFLADKIEKIGYEVRTEGEEAKNVFIDSGNEFAVITHMDTIEREMRIECEGEKIFGRGASDSKASIASILLFLEKAERLNFSVAFLSDEEEDAEGSQFFVKKHRVKKAIIMEPTSLRICNYHAGNIEIIFEVFEEEIHGSFCGGAIERAIEMIEELKKMNCWKRGKYFDSCMVIQEIKSLNPYYLNPERCEGRIEARLLAEQNANEIAEEMRGVVEKYGKLEIKEIWNGFKIDDRDEMIMLSRKACEKAKIPFMLDGMRSWTDALVFNKYGIKCIVFGPGDLKYSHTKSEFVNVAEIEKAKEFLYALNNMLRV